MNLLDSACPETVGDIESLVNVLGEDWSTQSIVAVIGSLNHLIQLAELEDLLHRPKDLESVDKKKSLLT